MAAAAALLGPERIRLVAVPVAPGGTALVLTGEGMGKVDGLGCAGLLLAVARGAP